MSRNAGVVWTAEEDELLRDMAAARRSAFLIAAKLKRSISSIQRRGAEIGVRVETPAAARRRARTIASSAH